MNKKSDPEIYFADAGEFFDFAASSVKIGYVPEKGVYALFSAEEAKSIETRIENGVAPDSIPFLKVARKLPSRSPFPHPKTPEDLWEVDILLNNICNFRCRYCYSAAGRSNKEIAPEAVDACIKYLFGAEKDDKLPLRLHFSGGGEPLVSFSQIRRTVAKIEEFSKNSRRKYSLGIVSNGSLLTEEIIEYLKEKKIDLTISFEVLKELQNRERGSYDLVRENIMTLHRLKCPFGIRTPLTEDALPFLPAIVEELTRTFPFVRSLVVEPVHSPEMYGTPDRLRRYLDRFFEVYTGTLPLAKAQGVALISNSFSLLKFFRRSKCMCKMVLTPEGTISYCARVASEKDKFYPDFVYGKIREGELKPNGEKFDTINLHDIEHLAACRHCFARWNCGGDCSLFHRAYPEACHEVSCAFIKRCLIWEMLKNLESSFLRKRPDGNFKEHIRALVRK